MHTNIQKLIISTQQASMDQPSAKRARLSMEKMLVQLEDDDEEPMMSGSDDEFEDIGHPEKERDECGVIDCDLHPIFTIPSFPSPPLPSPPTLHQPMSEGSTPPAPSSTPSSPSHTQTLLTLLVAGARPCP